MFSDKNRIRLLVVFIGMSLVVPFGSLNGAFAHPFVESGDPIKVNAEIKKLKVNWKGSEYDFIDYGVHAEVMINYVILEEYHSGDKVANFVEIEGWNPSYHGWVVPGKKVSEIKLPEHEKYDHDTCLDLENMELLVMVQEIDTDTLSAVGLKILGTEGGKYVVAKYLANQVGKGNISKLLKPSIPSILGQIVLYWMQENESLGSGTKTEDLSWVDDDFEYEEKITTNATKYGNAEVTFKISGIVDEDKECNSQTSYMQLPENEAYAMLDDQESRFYESYDDFIETSVINISQLFTEIDSEHMDEKTPDVGVVVTTLLYADDLMGLLAEDLEGDAETKYLEYFANARHYLNNDDFVLAMNSYQDAWDFYKNETLDDTSEPIPVWFKSNAKWWNEGLISDAEIIAALETLIETDVIPLERFIKNNPGLEHTAGVPKGGTFIPVYIKDVFGFWSDGIVSDNEIANSVGFLIGQGIIDSEKIREKRTSFAESAGLQLEQEPIEYRTGSEDTFLTKQPGLKKYANISMKMPRPDAKEIIFDFYEISKWNKLGALLLEKSSELESGYVKTQLDDAWNDYSDTNDMQIQQKAIALENDYKKINSKLNDLDSLIDDIDDFEGTIISESGKLGIPILELESAGKEPQSKIESDVKRGSSDFEKVHSQAEEAIRTGDKKTRILDDLLWDGYSSGRYVTPTPNKQTSGDSSFSSYYQLSDHLPVKADFIQERLHELQTPEVVPEPESEPTEETEPESTTEPVDENQETSVSSSETSSQTEYQITVVEMDGKQFPITQFTIWKWEGECDSMWHYHTASSHVTSLQNTIKNDPDPDNCGFGLVDYIPKTTTTITEDQMNQFKEMTGINPVGSEPIYGGEGP